MGLARLSRPVPLTKFSAMSGTAAHPDDRNTRSLSRGEVTLMVAALVVSVIAFQGNTTMLIPAIHTINTEFGRGAFATMSTYFSLAGAVSSVVLLRWSDYVGRKHVHLSIMLVMCAGTVICIMGTSLALMVVGRIMQGGSVITFGLT